MDFQKSNLPYYGFVGPFGESPLPQSGQSIEDAFFYGANWESANGVKIVSGPEVNEVYTQQIIAFIDKNEDGIKANTDPTLFDYHIRVFVSTSDILLREAYEKCSPDKNEVCVFLEDNYGDFLSKASSYIKIGESIRDDLRKRTVVAEMESGELNLIGLNVRFDQPELEFSGKEIKALIADGEIRDPSIATMAMFLQMATFVNAIAADGLLYVGEGILAATKKARKFLIFKPENWDPYVKGKDGAVNEKFEPYLLAPLAKKFDSASTISDDFVKEAHAEIKKVLQKRRRALINKFKKLPEIGAERLIMSLTKMVDKGIDFIISTAKSVLDAIIYLGKRWLNMVNAFFCGLWNGLVEAVLGIIDIIGYVFIGLGKIGEASENAKELIAQALEMFDEAIQAFNEADLAGMASTAITKIMEKVSELNLFAFSNLLSMEKMSYFLGAITGFIIELIVDIYFTGGSKAVSDSITKTLKFFDGNVLDKLRKLITDKIGATKESGVAFIFKILTAFITMLRQGKDALAKLIDDIVDVLKGAAKIPRSLWDEISKATGFTIEQLNQLQKAGLDFVDFRAGVCVACYLTNKLK